MVAWWRNLRAVQWSEVLRWWREFPKRSAAWWRSLATSGERGPVALGRGRASWRRLRDWWRGLGRLLRYALVTSIVLIGAGVPLGVFTWSGVSAALDARQAYQDLQKEMSFLTPVELVQVNVYHSLEGRFREAEESSQLARSRLGFLRAFQWVPVLGKRIKEVHLLLEMGFYQGRAGRNLAEAYRAAIATSLEGIPPEQASEQVARVLQEAAPQLNQAQMDLRCVAELREQLGTTERGGRYGVLIDRYLPAIQTVVYLSRINPEVIGHTYALSRELSALQELASDPLDVMSDPEEVGRILGNVSDQATSLESAFEVVRRATEVSDSDGAMELAAVRDVLDTLGPGVTLLRHVTAGTRSLVAMAEAIETSGFLSKEFGTVSRVSLDEAQQELTLARQEVASLQKLLSLQGIEAESFLPSIVFGDGSDISISSTERVEVLLDEAINATKFIRSFLGLDGPRTYLLLGQNEREIRATGGFIGIAVEARIDNGELTQLSYHDSGRVDREPLTDNPTPPEGLFWYLWMGRLLFRDANWNPHFPASAAEVAEIYRLGQGVQVDGVISGTKALMLDLVKTFGDITMPGVDGVLTREIAEDYAEGRRGYRCLPRHVSQGRGKRCFDEDLFFAMEGRVTTTGLSPILRRGLVELIKDHLDRKNILLHVFPPIDDSFLWERGWNGAIPSVDHDYLMVVDSSLPGHSTAGVKRSWECRVPLNPDQPLEAQFRLRYDNTEGPKDEICRQFAWLLYHCYWNYFRVYVSPMAVDAKIQMPPVPLHEGALKLIWGYPNADSASVVTNADTGPSRLIELGGYIAVEPGSVTTVPIQYRLRPEVLRPTAPDVYEYRLLIQKQPGMDEDRVSLAVELAPNAELLETSPKFNSRRDRWLLFDFTLESDTMVVVSFRMDRAR